MTSPDSPSSVQQLFGVGADRYDHRHYASGFRTFIGDRQRLLGSLLRSFGLPAGARVLDVACGPGRFLEAANEVGAASTGIDRSPDMLRTASRRTGDRSRLVVGDGGSLPFQSCSFDLVNCSGLIEYFTDPGPLLSEIYRVLRPGGRAMVSSTNLRSPALALGPLIRAVRRLRILGKLARAGGVSIDEQSLRARAFRMTFHTPKRLRTLLEEAGFQETAIHYCHLQLFPHPFDRLAPSLTSACVDLTDRALGVRLCRAFAEGLVCLGTRR